MAYGGGRGDSFAALPSSSHEPASLCPPPPAAGRDACPEAFLVSAPPHPVTSIPNPASTTPLRDAEAA